MLLSKDKTTISTICTLYIYIFILYVELIKEREIINEANKRIYFAGAVKFPT